MYREVTMVELIEVLRLWHEGLPKKRIAARLGLDPKTVRRYLAAADATGLRAAGLALHCQSQQSQAADPARAPLVPA